MEMRLDLYLTKNNYVESREKAQRLIKNKKVKVNGNIVIKPSLKVSEKDNVEVLEIEKYVSRAAYKLLKAFREFKINVENKICSDIGSSTGGFTQVLLENGAKKIYAIDSGTNQLHISLRNNPKIILMENTNARYLKKEDFDDIEFFTCDVSFISVTKLINSIKEITISNAEGIILIKPQFELTSTKLIKGIVKDEKSRKEAIKKVTDAFKKEGFEILGITESPIKGKEGNMEFLLYVRKNN
ncbi:23S rRNA (cytidine1920-2'-O)/16S rRNA (cytidine1409-2'-O)-methyltransferase [Marinitoga hydrogenitolerans DSM 16785]|uniref:23S rRNA (Cytidine1920-2'-O)/16S rRNA (Cytidine1409-2'-O)-methyltransferase n=1 Tax=Marinitoga hydrogenitolerans (strain DSM 16785 / JCM 12826 / AT1271) TaxID=1122195 RepID=A0A1M4U6B8_MARH1|nr:TlyA family RNA methyltransferase [Marinitoga hydrogenitolerans]SHE52184.1 23S rRNA (cytidine1920-2'-O)/16S rRNA (cytidine1409-2'-O)-methyltransferase [Marinitoga hydrogenitolerans DSM 16785]